MTDEDWEPLPPEQLVLHPGEDAALDRAAAAPASPAPAESESRVSSTAELQQQAAAVAAIQERLAAAGPSKSFVSAVERSSGRQRRRRHAAQRADLQAVDGRDVAPRREGDLPLPVAFAEGREGRDPREEEAWFCALPVEERGRLHDVWANQRERKRRIARWRPKHAWRAFAHTSLLAAVIGVLCTPLGLSLARVGAIAMIGGVAGLVAHICRSGRFGYAIAGVVTFLLGMGDALLSSPFVMIAGLMFSFGFGALGMEQEMRWSGGFDAEHDPERDPERDPEHCPEGGPENGPAGEERPASEP